MPLTIWIIWRTAHALVVLLAGGDVVEATFGWDTNWYLSVLRHGYSVPDPSYQVQANVAFFPGLAWVTRPFTWLFPERTAVLLVVNLASAAAFVAVHGAVRAVVDSRTARLAVIGLALWPMSLFLTTYYTEGLFIAATAAAVWAARRDQPLAAYPAAFLAGVTRSVGFVVGPLLALDRLVRLRRVDRVVVGYALSGPVALALVATEQSRQAGDALGFAHAQVAWGVELAAPWWAVGKHFKLLWANGIDHFHWGVALDSVAIVVVAGALVVATIRLWRRRSAVALLGWGWLAWAMPLFATISVSFSRYALAAWPALAALGWGTTSRARVVRVVLGLGAAAWSVMLIRLWVDGVWVA